jgi:2-hydroxychromene-2-carboxylate isomerase
MRLQYWFSVASPWTWLGSARFAELVQRSGVEVEVLPIDLDAVFAASGGRPFTERPEARRSYRQLELARWSRHLGVPVTLEPRYYPVDRTPASCLLIAARQRGLETQALLRLSHALLRAIWVEDRNIADAATLAEIASAQGRDGAALVKHAQHPARVAQLNADTQRAIVAGVFGAPTFIVEGERFWGQDRLDFLAVRLGLAG